MLGTQSVVGTVTDITSRLDIETLEEAPARELHTNEIGRVTLSLSHAVACENYANGRELGGFILVDRLTRNTVGAGMVTATWGSPRGAGWRTSAGWARVPRCSLAPGLSGLCRSSPLIGRSGCWRA